MAEAAAGRGAALLAKLKDKGKAVGAHLSSKKSIYGAGAGGLAGGFAAGRVSKKGKDE